MAKSAITSNNIPRPPIVTIMGHVDHGKTTLLDAIRHSHITTGEAGGITQHIGAYQVIHQDKPITFIDTPGHAAFAKMRSRGAQATDIIILVIAGTEGVKPQTVESIKHIKAAGVPYIIALNKMDLPEANALNVKSELAKYDVMVEEFGGKIPVVEVSAKTNKNIDQLLEMISLVADLNPPLADPNGEVNAIVIESHLNTKTGPIATAIVKNGTLKIGDTLYADMTPHKVRSLLNEAGKLLQVAPPSTPVQITGFKEVPAVGSVLTQTPHQAPAPIVEPIELQEKPEAPLVDIDALLEGKEVAEKPAIKVVLKADTKGTLEAITGNLTEELILIGSGIGPVGEADVLLAATAKATVIAFNVPVAPSAAGLAISEGVSIKPYKVIYELLEDIQKQILKVMEPTIDEQEKGTAEVIALFDIKKDHIAGCKVKTGEIVKADSLHVKRADIIIADAKIKSMRLGKADIDKAKAGTECGLILDTTVKIQPGDVLVAFKKLSA